MNWIRNRRRRIILSLTAALLVGTMTNMGISAQEVKEQQMILPENEEEESQNLTPIYAWWGTLYPKFAFSERKAGKVKISFWLAKALEWW